MLVNLINTAYCAMKILSWKEEVFSKYRTESVQEFRFALSEEIRKEVFYATLLQSIENGIKSNILIKALKQLVQRQCCCLHKL